MRLHLPWCAPAASLISAGMGGGKGGPAAKQKLELLLGPTLLTWLQGTTSLVLRIGTEVCGQALAEERARQAHEREVEVARLRAAQEKDLDRRGEMDELRARRCRPRCSTVPVPVPMLSLFGLSESLPAVTATYQSQTDVPTCCRYSNMLCCRCSMVRGLHARRLPCTAVSMAFPPPSPLG